MSTTELDAVHKTLNAKGYATKEQDGVVIVADPVQCSNGFGKWLEFTPVTIRNMSEARRFLSVRE